MIALAGLGIILITSFFIAGALTNRRGSTGPVLTPYDGYFVAYGAQFRVEGSLLKSIALWEHRGVIRPQAVATEGNGSESIGVMQLNSGNFAWIGRTLGLSRQDLFDPEKNIKAGAALARSMKNELGSFYTRDRLIQAWSLGIPKVKQGLTNPAYLAGVLHYLGEEPEEV